VVSVTEPLPPHRPLTTLELEVVSHLANGCTTAEIALLTHRSERNVKHHATRARQLFGARNTAQLCAMVVRSGQLP
jgi:DNA-binding NarL/FixJ family response regulator